MNNVQTAGGIIIRERDGRNEILLIKGVHGDKFNIPKGHVELGESLEQTAIREIKEETGLTKVQILEKIGVITRRSTERDGSQVTKDIHIFSMEIGDPTHGEADEDYLWVELDVAIKNMFFEAEADFLHENYDWLTSKRRSRHKR